MEIHWITIVFYVVAILIIYLLYGLIFQIKDTNEPLFGQLAVLVILGLLIESIILVFSWGWVSAVAAFLLGLYFCLVVKNYRMTLVIASVTAASILLAFLSGIQVFFSLYFMGFGILLISFVYEVVKYRKKTE
jgi:hypothetical protein